MFFSVFAVLLVCSVGGPVLSQSEWCEDLECSHDCVKVGVRVVCTCPEHLTLGPDSKTCKALSVRSEPVSVLLAMYRSVKRFSEGKTSYGELQTVLPIRVYSFDYHYENKEIYAYANNAILRYSFNDDLSHPSAPVTILTTDTRVTSLAVDWKLNSIYYVCEQRSNVETVTLDGTRHRVLATHSGSDWDHIVVDPYAKKVFWLGSVGVHSSSMDSTDAHSTVISWPHQLEGLSLDTHSQLMYVLRNQGNGSRLVTRCNYDGSNKEEVLTIRQSGSEIVGFGVSGKTLVWLIVSDTSLDLYKYVIPETGEQSDITLVEEIDQVVNDFKVYHPDVQKPPSSKTALKK